MEESTFIKCPSCLSEVEVSRTTFYQLAGKALRCPECSTLIPIPIKTTWQEFSGEEPSGDAARLQEKIAASLEALQPDEDARRGAPPASGRTEGRPGQKPSPEKTPSPPSFSKPEERMHKGILFALVVLLCLAGTWICVRMTAEKTPTTPPSPPLPTTTTTIPPSSPLPTPTPVVVVAPGPDREATASALFDSYRQAFVLGEWEDVQARQKELDSVFSNSLERDAFWKKVLPAEGRATLRLLVLCSVCVETKGKCPTCQGSGICATCKGQKTCTLCKGRSVRKKLCKECACRVCMASGGCATCQGTGRAMCKGCGGSGSTDMIVRETCRACGGSGYKAGLRRADQKVTRLPCLACGARGSITKTRSVTCEICEGTGRVSCSSCGGNGKCATCKGMGHKIPCSACDSTGSTDVFCPQCAGSGQCANCRGTGKCVACKGTGLCGTCGSKGWTEFIRLPILSEWMLQAKGCVLVEPDGTLTKGVEATPGRMTIDTKGRVLSLSVKPDEIVVIVRSDPAECTSLIRKP